MNLTNTSKPNRITTTIVFSYVWVSDFVYDGINGAVTTFAGVAIGG